MYMREHLIKGLVDTITMLELIKCLHYKQIIGGLECGKWWWKLCKSVQGARWNS